MSKKIKLKKATFASAKHSSIFAPPITYNPMHPVGQVNPQPQTPMPCSPAATSGPINGVYRFYEIVNFVTSGILTPQEGVLYLDKNKYQCGTGDVFQLVQTKIWSYERAKEHFDSILKLNPDAFYPYEIVQLHFHHLWSTEQCRRYLKKKSMASYFDHTLVVQLYQSGIWKLEEARKFLKLGPVSYEGPADFSLPE